MLDFNSLYASLLLRYTKSKTTVRREKKEEEAQDADEDGDVVVKEDAQITRACGWRE